jgi:hypothetical protein
MVVAGYVLSVFNHLQEEHGRMTPGGNTPIRRRGGNSQSQTQKPPDGSTTPAAVEFSQELIKNEMTQQMFT